MRCPQCGTDASPSDLRCPACNKSLGAAVATGVLPTPAPDAAATGSLPAGSIQQRPERAPVASSDDDAATRLGAVGSLPHDGSFTTAGTVDPWSSRPTTLPETHAGLGPKSARASGSGPLSVGQAFGTRYHIIRMLGIGGMGAVYQAWDAELGVSVALKVIRPEITADPAAAAHVERRFKRELLLARQVTHKNVVRIHDLGEIDRIKYITMSFVDGTDLATLLQREGQQPVPTILRIGRSVLSGLIAAHAAGVVHRDLKPENIMIDADGEALIMDFGIARSTGGPAPQSAADLASVPVHLRRSVSQQGGTAFGAIVGTVAYMAPEQAKGETVDQRADIYSFGLILYDMLLGRRRHEHAVSAIAELQARIEQKPPSAKSVMPEVPEALDALVSRCLEPDPAQRYQTTRELAADLERLDEDGNPIPIHRTVRLPWVIGAVTLLLALSGGAVWYFRPTPPPVQHEPVSVLIADFQNLTKEPTFDRTLESILKLALEGASFISAYDRGGMRTLGVQPPETLDERAAQEIAVKQGVNVVVSGSLQRRGDGYEISVRAIQPVTGKTIATATENAGEKTQVLGVATTLAIAVRKALGDNTSDSAQRFAMDTLTAASLEAVHDYALGQEALSNNRNDEAIRSYAQAVARDPNFGAAYTGMAMASVNIGQQEDAEKYAKEAIRHLDSVTERERYRTRGLFYRVTNDYQKCVKEYGELVAKYAADAAAHNNVALCVSQLRDMAKARDEMRHVVAILPKRALYRLNLALYMAYGSEFQAAEPVARQSQELGSPLGWLAVAFSQLGQNQMTEAADTYQKLAQGGPLYASFAASGLGDLALYEGRFADAARLLADGASADLAAKYADRAAAKFAALAYTQLLRQQKGAAVKAAESALAYSKAVKIRFLAARIFVAAGDIPRAQKLGEGLGAQLQAEPQALSKIIEGEAALQTRDAPRAIKLFTEANTLLDTWVGRFDLGRAYLESGALIEADSEFDRCIKRKGEALSLFLDEEPTYGYFPAVYYYQGRVREGLKTEKFVESYRTYLGIRDKAGEDPLLPEVRRRAGP